MVASFLSALWRFAALPVVLLATFFCSACASAVTCPVATPHAVSEAEQAYLESKYDRAVTLYQEQLQQHPEDPTITAALVEVLLRQQKIRDAEDLIQKAVEKHPDSAVLQTALAAVQYRKGEFWLAAPTAFKAMKLDPCYPQVRLLTARIMRLNSLYASEAKEVATAHLLDPHDPRIRLQWLETLPPKRRIAELESYLASPTGDDEEDLKDIHSYLDRLKLQVAEPHKACRLVSNTSSTSIDFARLMYDSNHLKAFGLDVKINERRARLEIDTGATGLLITRSIAEHAGLKRFVTGEIGGIGSEGSKASYTAYADDIKIGGLEFHDCQVEVMDGKNILDTDGLIGMDVFSRFLVTLDYPMRKLLLDPLPPRPGDTPASGAALETASTDEPEDDTAQSTDPKPAPSTASASTTAATKPSRGPHDRYVAPEMKEWTPVYRIGHNLMVPALLNDKVRKLFILDTGAFSTSISPDAAREVTKVHSDSDLDIRGVSGKVAKVYTADRIVFKFAHVKQENREIPTFEFPQISRNMGAEVSGFIGITTLGQLTVKIDYRDGLIDFRYDANRGYKYPTQSY